MAGGLEEWNSEVKISEEQVGDCHGVGNHELEEVQVNNDIEEDQLGNPQYELTQRNENLVEKEAMEL